ncbi:hypothetical protein Csa_021639 [Cucumis sativus]|nr:hypothetical protein Csa_021639 [Cucumis sativus]
MCPNRGKKLPDRQVGVQADKVFWKGKTESDCMFTNNSGEHASAKVSEAKCKTQPFNETDRRPICFGGNTFQSTYGKPLLAARDSKCSARDAEAGALAMEALHKQVMPFLLRRTKDEVLSDLPEKIIQDRFCDLSPVQLKLYERFSGSHVRQEISSMVKSNESEVPQESSGSTGILTYFSGTPVFA